MVYYNLHYKSVKYIVFYTFIFFLQIGIKIKKILVANKIYISSCKHIQIQIRKV